MTLFQMTYTAIPDIPLIKQGVDLADIILQGMNDLKQEIRSGDVFVLAQKIVSKAEGRMVDLRTVQPSSRALELAAATGKDPELVEVILRESRSILRQREELLIVEHRLGFVCANAGIDRSNVQGEPYEYGRWVLMLPEDPDGTAEAVRARISHATGTEVGVLIIDSHGRAWRMGTEGVCIGAAGFPALLDLRGVQGE